MANIRPPSKDIQRAFRAELAASQKGDFDALVGLIGAPRSDIGWHHKVGRHIVALIRAEDGRGSERIDRLSKALGRSPSMLRKAARFAALYPTEAGLKVLTQMDADWTRLELTFSVEDADNRHELLRKALDEEWTIQYLRFEVQRRFPSHRAGVGGSPRTRPAPHGPEVTLRELERFSRRWNEFYTEAFSGLKPKDWKAFERRCNQSDGERLRELVRNAAKSLADVLGQCAKAKRQIKDLLQRIP